MNDPRPKVPVLEVYHPQWVEVNGDVYELKWNGNVITRVLRYDESGPVSLRYNEMPEQVRKLLE